jgi:hypothetical protein
MFPARESLVSDILLGTGKPLTFLKYSVAAEDKPKQIQT